MTYQRLTAPVQLDAISALLDALETCHVCGGTLHLEDVEPTHCEDCSSYCEDHEEPAEGLGSHRRAVPSLCREA